MCRKFSFFISFVLVLCLVGSASAFTMGEKDIGGPAIAGSSSYDDVNNIWTVSGSGADIWDSWDQLHYVYRPLSGDGSLEVKITSMDITNDWAKAGVMIRETSAANSKFALMAMTGVNGVQLAYRSSTGGGCAESSTPGQVVPSKLRLTRTGDDFKAEYGFEMPPGSGDWLWANQATVTIPMNADVLIGFAVCSHDNSLLCEAVFEEVVLTAPAYEKAWDLEPIDGSMSVPLTPTLTWLPGDSVTSHDVYLGTDPAALSLVDTKALGDESYTPGTPLAEGTVYYWQIVEQPGDYASAVMSFKTERLGTGAILREVWEGIGGTMVSDLTSNPAYPLSPTWSDLLPSMASYDLDMDNYGARMQGFLYPETSGDYTFWIAADDACQLWLSTDEKSCNAEMIAYHNAWTDTHNWFWYAEQQSAPVSLVGGQKYFIRALWKEGGGGDHCQVAWYGPDQPDWPVDGSDSAVIGGYYLMPADDVYAGNPSPANGSTVTVHEAATVSWSAGKGAVSHDVYLGTDPGAMTHVATVAMPDTSCALPALAVDTTYYWRVDAYDGAQTYVLCAPWSFTTAEWISLDIGTSGGSTSIDPVSGVITVNADGADIWDNSDHFHYYYTTVEMTRDIGEVSARVLTVPTTDDWSKTGVMIRETRAANSRHATMASTLADAATLQYRTETGGWSGDQTEWGIDQPRYMRLTRQGNTITGYHSTDGANWVTRGSVDIPMEAGKYVCIGLAVTSHSDGVIGTATFEDLRVSTPDPRQAWGPTPGDGAENVPLYMTLRFNAGDDADEHRLYFDGDYDDVYYGLVAPVVLPAGTTEYAVGPLNLGKPYYWVVDEVIKEGREWPVTMGEVWSFRVEDSRLVEDFEAYDDPPVPLEPLPEQVIIAGDYTIPGYTIYSVEPSEDCLLADYQFEGDANDSSGNGRDGMLVGDANVLDGVLDVDGDGDCVDLGNDPNFNFAGNFSISCWIKLRSWGGGWGNVIVGKCGEDGVGWQVRRFSEDENLCFTTRGIDNDDYPRSNLSPSLDQWYHIAAIRDGDKKLLYINGELDSTADVSTDPVAACDHNVYVGARANGDNTGPESFFNGMVDDMQIYCRALSQGEVRYINGLPDLVIPDVYVPPVYGPLIAYYEFEGDANDSSGNGYDGTLFADANVEDGVLKLDGDGDYMDVVDAPLTNITGQVTVAAWLKLNVAGGDMKVAGNQDGSTGGYKLGYCDGKMEFEIRTSGGSAILNRWEAGGTVLAADTWYHVVGVYSEGNYIRTYVNGLLDREMLTTEVLGGSAGTLKIGREPFGEWGYLNGMVDGFRLYNTELTYGQILTLAEYSASNPIHNTWSENGATLGLDYFEKHGGAKSMKVDIGSIGEVSRGTPYSDWDSGDAKALVLYFKGDPCNVIDDMYLALATSGSARPASTAFSYDGDMNDLASGDWTEWNIDLSGVSGDVEQMAIGLSGVGTVNFDDIRLYPVRCRPELGPLADLTDDCLVDGRDARIMAADWLMYDETSTGLVLRYEFEGNLEDSSGYGRTGTAHGEGIGFEDDPTRGMVLSLPGGDDIYVSAPPVGISGNDLTTIACWAKADHTSIPDWTLVFGFSTPSGDCGSHFNIGSIGGPGGVGAHAWCWEETIFTDEEALEWRHYAMTYDGSRIDYYGDGVWKDTDPGKSNVIDLWRRGDYVNVGKRNTQASSFPGKVDDARIYKRVLTEAEIATVMGGGEVEEIYFPIESVANIYDEEPVNSKIINFKDYAILANEWLSIILWP